MPAATPRLTAAACALLLLAAPALQAAGKTKQPVAKAARVRHTHIDAAEAARREAVVRHTNDTFTLFGAELALQKGDPGTALGTYIAMLERTRDPEVAERAIDMAVGLGAYQYAEQVYQSWLKIEPAPGPALQRITWMRDMVRGNYANARDGFTAALEGADEAQRSRIFLLVAQIAAQNPEVAKIMEETVHRQAAAHQDKPDAVIADAILSALNDKPSAAVAALQRLAALDSEILPPTYLTLRLIGQRKPDTINRFFAETDTDQLSPVWQELQIEALVYAGKKDEAGRLLQNLIDKRPSADLYIQAALLAANRKAPLEETVGYLTKAYQSGTQEQQSRAAVIAVLRNADNKNFAAARKWVEKIHAPDYAFDKAVLTASLDAEERKWPQAAAQVRRARAMTAKQGRFFDSSHLDRIETLTAARLSTPQQALAALNRLYTRAVKEKAEPDILGNILYQRALVYSDRLHQPEKAVADLRRFIQLAPGDPNAQNALGYTLLTLPKPQTDEAFALISAAFEQVPEEPAVNDSIGWAYFLKGDPQAALPYLQYAFQEQPEAEVAAHLGEVLWTLGRKDEARAILKQGQSLDAGHRTLQDTLRRLGLSADKPAADTGKSKGKAAPAKKKKAV